MVGTVIPILKTGVKILTALEKTGGTTLAEVAVCFYILGLL